MTTVYEYEATIAAQGKLIADLRSELAAARARAERLERGAFAELDAEGERVREAVADRGLAGPHQPADAPRVVGYRHQLPTLGTGSVDALGRPQLDAPVDPAADRAAFNHALEAREFGGSRSTPPRIPDPPKRLREEDDDHG